MKIGNVELPNNVFLGPMAGVTDRPFRTLCHEMDCGLVYSEMVSAKGIYYDNANTKELLDIGEDEKPASIQLFGSDPEIMGAMAKKIEGINADFVDINMGCPVPKVVKNGEGSALMKTPELAGKIIRAMVDSQKKPVTVKIRKGFTEDTVNAVEMAVIAEANGAAAVAVHGRTREQYYSGKADWSVIAAVKRAVDIPVVGNGDVTCGEAAMDMMEQTGCDFIMIGRAALGNPWIFREVTAAWKGEEIPSPPTAEEKKAMMIRHLDDLASFKGEYAAVREMRKHVGWYIKGLAGAASFRGKVNQITDIDELRNAIKNI